MKDTDKEARDLDELEQIVSELGSMRQSILIDWYCDGWRVYMPNVEGSKMISYSWNHNDEDMGTVALKGILEHLGYQVTVEECY
jgi:hypothetical protein